jgi:hypothetical protein
MLADHSSARVCPILLLLLLAHLSTTGLLVRGLAVVMQFLYALIAFVS